MEQRRHSDETHSPPPPDDGKHPPHNQPTNLAVHVGDATVALGGAVELADLGHAEALGEGLPHVGPQAVADGQAHAVPALRGPHGLGEQVAADLPDVLHHLRRRDLT